MSDRGVCEDCGNRRCLCARAFLRELVDIEDNENYQGKDQIQ